MDLGLIHFFYVPAEIHKWLKLLINIKMLRNNLMLVYWKILAYLLNGISLALLVKSGQVLLQPFQRNGTTMSMKHHQH